MCVCVRVVLQQGDQNVLLGRSRRDWGGVGNISFWCALVVLSGCAKHNTVKTNTEQLLAASTEVGLV